MIKFIYMKNHQIIQIGIFAQPIDQRCKARFSKLEEFYYKLFLASKKLRLEIFIFDLSDILKNRMVQGRFITKIKNGKNVWIRKIVPMPLAIWDRSFGMTSEQRQKLLRLGVKFINPLAFAKISRDKIQTYQTLRSFFKKEKVAMQPETALYTKDNAPHWLKKFNYLFFKPQTGSKGKGIFSIRKVEDRFVLNQKRPVTRKVLIKKISQFTKKETYIVQQGIEVLTINNAPFDIRVLVQRGGGSLVKIHHASRIAGENQITSNIHSGGFAQNTQKILKKIGWDKNERSTINDKIKNFSLKLHKFLEENIGQPIMEFALDLAIDENHQIYLLEINARPGREIFQITSKSISELTFVFPLKYIKSVLISMKK